MNRKSLRMSEDFKKFISGKTITTEEELVDACSKCATVGDVEELIYGGMYLDPALGSVEFSDYDDFEFEVSRIFVNPETGDDESQVLNFEWAEVSKYDFYFKVTAQIERVVKIQCEDEGSAEERLEEILKTGEFFSADETADDYQFEGSASYTDISY
jgi:hypothetical protein